MWLVLVLTQRALTSDYTVIKIYYPSCASTPATTPHVQRCPALNYLTNKHPELVSSFCYGSLKRKLRLLDEFHSFTFKVTSASTCTFRSEDFIYT